ncbi:1461_t:CDS:1, partial [Funneliformis mosseae]
DKIKKYETERLIKYLREDSKSEGLELNNNFFTKLEEKEITDSSFLKLTRWDFKEYEITLGQALELENYIKRLDE